MASSREYLDFILDQLSELEDVSCRAMMGEYIIYYRGRVAGGIKGKAIFGGGINHDLDHYRRFSYREDAFGTAAA